MKNKEMNKKGLSEIIGYVILIVIAIAMSFIVYTYLKTYTPGNQPTCESDVSLLVKESKCVNGKLVLTLQNNGLFNIEGFIIRATANENSKLATVNLADSGSVIGGTAQDGVVLFSPSPLDPSKTNQVNFTYSSNICNQIGSDCGQSSCVGTITCSNYNSVKCGVIETREGGICKWDVATSKCVGPGTDCRTFSPPDCSSLVTDSICSSNSDPNLKSYYLYGIEAIPVSAKKDENGKLTTVICGESKLSQYLESLTNCGIYS